MNLATGEEELHFDPDLTVYNPVGPSVAWTRSYASLRNASARYSMGWSHNYNVGVVVKSGVPTLTMDNGAQFDFSRPAVDSTSQPTAICVPTTGGNEFAFQRVYDSSTVTLDHYALAQKDRVVWTFFPVSLGHEGIVAYRLTQIIDRNGNAIKFNYTDSLLNSITDKNDIVLLTIVYNNEHISQIYDRWGRAVNYGYTNYETYGDGLGSGGLSNEPQLTSVSQTAPDSSAQTAAVTPARYTFGYALIAVEAGEPFTFLNKITVPSPMGGTDAQGNPNTSSALIAYDSYGLVQQLTDQNLNTRAYDFSQSNETTVTVRDAQGNLNYRYAADFNQDMSETARKNSNGTVLHSKIFNSSLPDPYRPVSTTDAYNHTTSYTWDSYGNLLTVQTPRQTTTT